MKIFFWSLRLNISKLYIFFFLLIIMLFLPAVSEGQIIAGPEVDLVKNDLYVSFSVMLGEKQMEEIRKGIEKELKLNIDLFRVWRVWPDEFTLGKVNVRTLKADPIKKEYVATSLEGNTITEKRFKSFESMIEWSLSVRNMKLTNTREIDPGKYFVRITVESKIRKLPPVIGYFFIFVSENEFRLVRDSAIFSIEGGR
jgi:hypothetical protein